MILFYPKHFLSGFTKGFLFKGKKEEKIFGAKKQAFLQI